MKIMICQMNYFKMNILKNKILIIKIIKMLNQQRYLHSFTILINKSKKF